MDLNFLSNSVEYTDTIYIENTFKYDSWFLNNMSTIDKCSVKSLIIFDGFSIISDNYDMIIKFIVDLLQNSNIKIIELFSELNIHSTYLNRIFDAIIKNKTLETIKLYSYVAKKFNWTPILLNLENCKNIKSMEIGSSFNRLLKSCRLPKKLDSLTIQNLDYQYISALIKKYKLKKLIVYSGFGIMYDLYEEMKNSRTLLYIKCIGYNEKLLNHILEKNRNSLVKAETAAKTLLMIRNRKYSRNECDLNLWIPKEIVIIIAKYVKESYDDPKWSINDKQIVNNDSTIIRYGIIGTIGLFLIYSFFKR